MQKLLVNLRGDELIARGVGRKWPLEMILQQKLQLMNLIIL